MKKNTLILLWIGLLPLFLVGCGVVEDLLSDPAAGGLTSIGDAANGEALFAQPVIGASNAPGCITCHSLEPDVVIVGPSQVGVATRAQTRVPGQSAEEYIRASITDPNVFVVEGFAEGMMYQNYGTDLTDREINDLVAYALTLE
jgi:sulfur-oxidizing protein SoxX